MIRIAFPCLFLLGVAAAMPSSPPPPASYFPRSLPWFHRQLDLPVLTPGHAYAHDPAEKDWLHGDSTAVDFRTVRLEWIKPQVPGKVLVDFVFRDGAGTTVRVKRVDLLDLVPVLSQKGEWQIPEYLLKEYERFGIVYYHHTGAVEVIAGRGVDPALKQALGRVYQAGIFNNCLDPGKWEVILSSRYFGPGDSTQAKAARAQRYRVLSHAWFHLDPGLYQSLFALKNPGARVSPAWSYDSMTRAGEALTWKPPAPGRPIGARFLEIGWKTKRELFEVDEEEMYKYLFGLVLNRSAFHTYDDVLRQPLSLARFTDRGFYRPGDTARFDYGWLRSWETVQAEVAPAPGPDRFLNLKLSGPQAPYSLVLGNFDLGRLNPNRLVPLAFGFNSFPKQRPARAGAYSTGYNLGPDGKGIDPYLLLVDNRTGHWVNNQKLGLEQIFVGWQSERKDALRIYVVTYERMLPVWMARLALEDAAFREEPVRNAQFRPEDTSTYRPGDAVDARREREAARAGAAGKAKPGESVVLDFEGLRHDDATFAAHGYVYEEKGFTLSGGGLFTASPFRTLGTKAFPFTGSTALINGNRHGVNYLARRLETPADRIDNDGNLFDLVSISLARFSADPDSAVTFVATRPDSSTASITFKPERRYGPQAFTFNGDFRGVAAVRWIANGFQFDDIRLRRR